MRTLLLIVAAVAGLLVYSVIYSRKMTRKLFGTIAAIRVADIPEIQRVGLAHIQKEGLFSVNYDDPLETADRLEQFILGKEGKLRFPTFKGLSHMSWMIYVGSILGELLRRHGQMDWVDDGGPALVIRNGDRSLTAHPFEKVVKHEQVGTHGDLRAYLALIVTQRTKLIEEDGQQSVSRY